MEDTVAFCGRTAHNFRFLHIEFAAGVSFDGKTRCTYLAIFAARRMLSVRLEYESEMAWSFDEVEIRSL